MRFEFGLTSDSERVFLNFVFRICLPRGESSNSPRDRRFRGKQSGGEKPRLLPPGLPVSSAESALEGRIQRLLLLKIPSGTREIGTGRGTRFLSRSGPRGGPKDGTGNR